MNDILKGECIEESEQQRRQQRDIDDKKVIQLFVAPLLFPFEHDGRQVQLMGLNDIEYGYQYGPNESKEAEDCLTAIHEIPHLTFRVLGVMVLDAPQVTFKLFVRVVRIFRRDHSSIR